MNVAPSTAAMTKREAFEVLQAENARLVALIVSTAVPGPHRCLPASTCRPERWSPREAPGEVSVWRPCTRRFAFCNEKRRDELGVFVRCDGAIDL